MEETLFVEMKELKDILYDPNLQIPYYQRPYSWTEDQIKPLLEDLYKRKDNELTILGSLIFHLDGEHQNNNDNRKKNIVDGQQRLITFSIIEALSEENQNNLSLLEHHFENTQSQNNILDTTKTIKEFFNRKGKIPSLDNIKVVVVSTKNLEDAFAFFDSQNTRGKKLEDYDILKAHHLRFIKSNKLATICAQNWESIQKNEKIDLKYLLEILLARGRKWSHKHNTPPNLRKEFKSQRKDKKETKHFNLNRYQQGALFSSWSYSPEKENKLEYTFRDVDATFKVRGIEINKNIPRYLPFQITQTIEGGELFFWYTEKYHDLAIELFDENNSRNPKELIDLIKLLEGFSWNIGTAYILDVLKGSLLFYFDKFGYNAIEEVASNLFYSLFWLRFKQHTVQYASIYKFIREHINPFALIQEASFSDFIIDQTNEFLEDKYKGNNYKELRGFRAHFYEALFQTPNSSPIIKENPIYKGIKNEQ